MATRVAVVGATGRMGALASRLIDEADDFELAARISSSDSLDLLGDADLVLDFTVPAVSPEVVDAALTRGLPVLVGTSGWTAERIAAVGKRLAALPELAVVIV